MVMMKMAAFSTAAALLLFFSVFAPADSKVCDMYAAAKGNFTVPLQYSLKDSEHLRWRHENSVILDRRPNKFVQGSARDITQNGSLILKNLNRSKEGAYTPEIYEDGKSKGHMGSINLCILEPVSQPRVKIQCSSSSVKFTCTVDKGDDPTFEWLQNSKILAKGSILSRSVKDVETVTFNCIVSNKVSSMTSPAVKQNCTKRSDGESLLTKQIYGINIWILVGSGGGLVLVLMILVIVCCIRNKRRKRKQLKDEEELRLQLASANQHHHQHQHQHHHHQQQPAGHTGPRQNRSRQQRNPQRNQQHPTTDHPNGHPQPSPRRPTQAPRPADTKEEQPPPLPQPRKKGPRAP